MSEWSKLLKINYDTLHKRYKKDPNNLDYVFTSYKIKKHNQHKKPSDVRSILYNNQTHTLREWSKILGIGYDTLNYRYNQQPNNLDYVFSKEKHSNSINFITYNNETHNLRQWSKILGIDYGVLQNRYKKDPNNLDYVFSKEDYRNKKKLSFITYNNKTHSLQEWSKLTGIKYITLYNRFKRNPNNLDYVFSKKSLKEKSK